MIFSNDADLDLELIAATSEEQWDRRQADRYAAKLDKALRRIAVFPASGETFPPITEMRSVKAGVHRIYYQPQGETAVLIVRILDARMDANSHLL